MLVWPVSVLKKEELVTGRGLTGSLKSARNVLFLDLHIVILTNFIKPYSQDLYVFYYEYPIAIEVCFYGSCYKVIVIKIM